VSGLVNVVCIYKSLKVAAPLFNCTFVERRAVTDFYG